MTMVSDVVLPGVSIYGMRWNLLPLDDVPIYFQPFASSPFGFTEE